VNNWKGLFASAIPKFGHDGWSTSLGVRRLAAPKAFNSLPGETFCCRRAGLQYRRTGDVLGW
jgi:hypothetical protein